MKTILNENEELNFSKKLNDLLIEMETIRDRYTKSLPKKTYFNQVLSSEKAIAFFSKRGYKISLSKLYKLTSAKKIPFQKFNNKLVFEKKELLHWLKTQTQPSTNEEAIRMISKSAIKKLTPKYN